MFSEIRALLTSNRVLLRNRRPTEFRLREGQVTLSFGLNIVLEDANVPASSRLESAKAQPVIIL